MDSAAPFLSIVVAIFVIGGLFFYLAVFPIWMILNAGLSDRANNSKAVWIILMVICWTLGAVVYGTFAARGVLARLFGVIGLLFTAVMAGLFVMAYTYLGPYLSAAPEEIEARIAALAGSQLETQQKEQLARSVKNLLTEAPFEFTTLATKPEKLQVNLFLLQRLFEMTEDGQLTKEEFSEWLKLYESRETLQPDRVE